MMPPNRLGLVISTVSLLACTSASLFASYATNCTQVDQANAVGGPVCSSFLVGVCCSAFDDTTNDGVGGCLTIGGIPGAEAPSGYNTCIKNSMNSLCCARMSVGDATPTDSSAECPGDQDLYCCATEEDLPQGYYGLNCSSTWNELAGQTQYNCTPERPNAVCA